MFEALKDLMELKSLKWREDMKMISDWEQVSLFIIVPHYKKRSVYFVGYYLYRCNNIFVINDKFILFYELHKSCHLYYFTNFTRVTKA
jgi:hypothetical protein